MDCFIEMNERSEGSEKVHADFFFVFFLGKVLQCTNNSRCAFIHIDALMNAVMYRCNFYV